MENPKSKGVSLLIALLCVHAPSHETSASPRPNIILTIADNLGYGDIGPFNPECPHRTPHLDRMAAEGIRLTSFYSTAPVCTPSRASFMTGCYPRRVGLHIDENGPPVLTAVSPRGIHADELTLAELLRAQGYATAIVGKWHLGDQPPFLPRKHGFDSFFGLPYSEDMDTAPARPHMAARPALPLIENETVIEAPPDRNLLTKRFTERAIKFITTHKDKPFFLYLPQTMPGSTTTYFASENFLGKSANGRYGDAVEELDWSAGEIFKTLKDLGIDDNTLVIWTSDNGAILRKNSDGHGICKPLKGMAYSTDEGGMRMPFLARWPGQIPAGISTDELTSAMDLLPTFMKLAGGDAPTDRVIDGHDIRPLLFGEKGAKSPTEFFHYYFMSQLQAVRSGPHKLYLPLEAKWTNFQGKGAGPVPARLYDLRLDLQEENELSASHPDIVARLQAAAEKARETLGDLNRPGTQQRPAGHYENPRPLWLRKVEHRPQ